MVASKSGLGGHRAWTQAAREVLLNINRRPLSIEPNAEIMTKA
jgi:hypothetical protein